MIPVEDELKNLRNASEEASKERHSIRTDLGNRIMRTELNLDTVKLDLSDHRKSLLLLQKENISQDKAHGASLAEINRKLDRILVFGTAIVFLTGVAYALLQAWAAIKGG